ncbi:F-box protein [Nymphaea thermarum]|nr:F-box protein [Nymphaea thermarum]
MGRSGEREEEGVEDELHSRLVSNGPKAGGSDSGERCPVVCPINSNFAALSSGDVLRCILERLPLADLARAACVCRIWRVGASDQEIVSRSFRSPWKLKEIVGRPSSTAFWRDNRLDRFAISHRIQRGDTVASLAVKYGVQVMEIKRLNNMISDHGMYSRERLLIPIGDSEVLRDQTCYIELDNNAKREVAVLYLEDVPEGKGNNMSPRSLTDSGKKKIVDSMKRSLQADDGTVKYYLSISNGDPRAAFSLYSEDLTWEGQFPGEGFP